MSDVDGFAKRVKEMGGTVHRGPEDIPGVGRFAVCADPHGATFFLFKGSSDAQPQPVPQGTPGHIGWHELYAGNGEKAFAFYSGLFGWTKTEAMDMGPMGTYQLFATDREAVGGMMTKPEQVPAPMWLYYFNVDNIDAAAARTRDNGGQVFNGPMEVPGGILDRTMQRSTGRNVRHGRAETLTPSLQSGPAAQQQRGGFVLRRQSRHHNNVPRRIIAATPK